uniref:THAP domaincontaining protein 9like [Strongylocentrotus purpuratus] n=1 Tax=Lepeophtheirus salmonis TaxID=72036 RepID=A0A0K2SZ36_LEPSM
MALPHPSVIRSWYGTIDGNPGFTVKASKALKLRVEQQRVAEGKVYCNLTLDEMSIRK